MPQWEQHGSKNARTGSVGSHKQPHLLLSCARKNNTGTNTCIPLSWRKVFVSLTSRAGEENIRRIADVGKPAVVAPFGNDGWGGLVVRLSFDDEQRLRKLFEANLTIAEITERTGLPIDTVVRVFNSPKTVRRSSRDLGTGELDTQSPNL